MGKHFKVSSSFKWRLGENVILWLMECLTTTVSFDIFMDISFRLLTHLEVNNINDVVTPLRLLELFFEDVLVDMIFGYTKLNGHTEKVDISFEITNQKIRYFLSMLLLSGCHKPPERKMYWERPPILLCKQGLIQCLVIRSSVFFGISIFFDNEELDK